MDIVTNLFQGLPYKNLVADGRISLCIAMLIGVMKAPEPVHGGDERPSYEIPSRRKQTRS